MNGRVLLVTGGGRGIGAAVARLAAAEGYAVAVNYKSNAGAADAVVDAIRKAGGRAVAVQGDMAVEADVVRAFAAVDRDLGRLTHLVYNSGITGKNSRFEQVATQTLREVVELNVIGAFYAVREAIPRISTRHGGKGGAMVLLSSAAATLGSPGEYVWYAASKGAIDSMTVGLACELAGDGIRVNAVAPGATDTDIHEPGRLARVTPFVPMKRAGTADEIARAIVFLLSDASSYTTGAILRVAGGR
ncbi:MAG: SDR family oxidoreductase [Pseudorhodoplanes sp.]|nr:SDR family oxidoreductase [Pseudorhodoplanes sp.]MCQ3942971.1 NAD(P)-dependent oxidoreductase [Alphaproteobacteria bacterium]GIK82345.1 MAG: glucose-1-dehydrogenase [Alphaproteobacteria bacterium]